MESILSKLRQHTIVAATTAGEGHISSALSILDILWVLYDLVLRIDPKDPKSEGRDRFVLSKGHGSLALYAVLAEKGFFPISELEHFASFDSLLGGHPDRNKVPGVEASTGSLGHGFPISVGIALGLKIKKIDSKVFVLIGDGEANEGSVWESALLASHHNLSNLCCIVDYNHSTDRALKVGDMVSKFKAFGWESFSINGHDHDEIYSALSCPHNLAPLAIVAETVKGFGCKMMENNPEWHHKSPRKEDLPAILEQLS